MNIIIPEQEQRLRAVYPTLSGDGHLAAREAFAGGMAEGRQHVRDIYGVGIKRSGANHIWSLAEAQEQHASRSVRRTSFRLFTERFENLPSIVARHFGGATFTDTLGLFDGVAELSTIIEIVATVADYPRVRALAQDIRRTNAQHSVLVAYQDRHGFQAFDVRD